MSFRKWLCLGLLLGLPVFAPLAPGLVGPAAAATTAAAIDLNSATAEELATLPGIGPVKAKAIVEGRPYKSLKDFESRGIVPASTVEKFKGQVTVTKAKPAATEAAATPATADEKIDLNTATVDELATLPGIGPARAASIIEARPYKALKDFEARSGVPASAYDKLKGLVSLSKPRAAKPAVAEAPEEKNPPEPLGKIDLNTATAEELEVLPGVGPARAKAIVEGRPYASLAQFESKGIVPASVFDKFKGATEVTGSKASAASGQGTPGQLAAQKRIRMCGSKWRAAKAADRIPAGMSWPQFWSQCNTALKERGY